MVARGRADGTEGYYSTRPVEVWQARGRGRDGGLRRVLGGESGELEISVNIDCGALSIYWRGLTFYHTQPRAKDGHKDHSRTYPLGCVLITYRSLILSLKISMRYGVMA